MDVTPIRIIGVIAVVLLLGIGIMQPWKRVAETPEVLDSKVVIADMVRFTVQPKVYGKWVDFSIQAESTQNPDFLAENFAKIAYVSVADTAVYKPSSWQVSELTELRVVGELRVPMPKAKSLFKLIILGVDHIAFEW